MNFRIIREAYLHELSIGTLFTYGGHTNVCRLTHKQGENGYKMTGVTTYPFKYIGIGVGIGGVDVELSSTLNLWVNVVVEVK